MYFSILGLHNIIIQLLWIISKTQIEKENEKTVTSKQTRSPHIHHPYMREVESESESKMMSLIAHRSSQQATQRFVSTRAQIWSNSVESNFFFFDCQNAPLCASPPFRPFRPRPILILLFSAIVLAIATIFGDIFGLIPRGFAGVNVENNILNNECELAKSGLNNNDDCDNGSSCHNQSELTPPPNDTAFCFNPIGAGLCEFNVYGDVLS